MTANFNLRMFPVLALVLLAIAALTPLLVPVAVDAGISADAVVRHGADASVAQACKGDGTQQVFRFYNEASHRSGRVCQVNGVWAVVILDEAGREVTSFVKNKMKTFQQVLKYMRNAGYELVQ